jgi:2-aminoadipate transaminase
MLAALQDQLPDATWTNPRGGFYVWVRLPGDLDAQAMLPRAVTARVAYVPGTAFYADDQGQEFVRLSYCYPTPERIAEGVRRLAGVVGAELELQSTFGVAATPGRTSPRDVRFPGPDLT